MARISDNILYVSKHGIKAAEGSVVFRSADEVNAIYPIDWESPYSNDIPVTEFITAESEQFVRIFKDGTNTFDGRWIVKKSEIEHLLNDPQGLKDFLSLPNIPNKIVDVNIPPNVRLRTGKAGQNAYGNGGGIQFEIPSPDPYIPDWFSNVTDL